MQLTNYTGTAGVKVGWVDQPSSRGTIDIIWSCILLLVSSKWIVVHLNVPAVNDSYWTIVGRKFRWALLSLLAPEIIVILAGLQWASARRGVKLMRSLGNDKWTMVHAFFADMGGFVLCAPDMPPFPINSRAVYYLVQTGHIDAPNISQAEIQDRSKADVFVKLVACIQGVYMIAQCLARRIQNIEISCLELSTVAYIMCTAVSYVFRVHKPLNVERAVHIQMSATMHDVLLQAPQASSSMYEDTPMDFVEQPGWKSWRRRPMFTHWGGLLRRPVDKIPNDYIAEFSSLTLPIFMWVVMWTYAGIHILAWNFSFPTNMELWIWRAGSVISFVVLLSWGSVEVLTVLPWFNFDMTVLGIWQKKSTKRTFWRKWVLDAPGTLSAVSYFVARAFLVVEMFVSLRAMDSTVYKTIGWTNVLPHV